MGLYWPFLYGPVLTVFIWACTGRFYTGLYWPFLGGYAGTSYVGLVLASLNYLDL